MAGPKYMDRRAIALLLLSLSAAAVSACTSSSSSSPSLSTGGSQYDSQYRQATNSTAQTYGPKQDDKQKGDSAITIMQEGMETGDVYPGDDYYVYAVVDNPTQRKNLQYVWSVSDGSEITEVPESERGRLQKLVEEKYSSAKPADTAATGAATPPVLPQSGATPEGAASVQPSETGGAAATVPAPTAGTPGTSQVTVPVPPADASKAGSASTPLVKPAPVQPSASKTGAVDSGDQHMTSNVRGIFEKRIVAGPDDDTYFSKDEQAEISKADSASADASGDIVEKDSKGDLLDEVAASQQADILNDTQKVDNSAGKTPQDMRNGARRLVTDDQRAEPDGSPNVAASGQISGDPYATPDKSDTGWQRKSTAQVDAERGFIKGGADTDADSLQSDLADAESDSAALRSHSSKSASETKEVTADDSYKKFTLVTDEPYIRWTPSHPGDAKIFVKVRWKTDDLTKPTELPVTIRLKEPKVSIADDEFPDMVREDEPLYVRLDGDNLPAFHKGLFTLSFDADTLSFRDAELGEFFDGDPSAKLFYMQPDKLAGKVIFAIDSNATSDELSGSGPVLYVKFKAKRDVTKRDDTKLALVEDASSQYILNADGDNILPLAVPHPAFETALVMPPTLAGTGIPRTETPGQPIPGATPATPAGTAPATGTPAAGTAALSGPTTPPVASGGTNPPVTLNGPGQNQTVNPDTLGKGTQTK